jgi:hypothetical protein
MLRIKSEHAIGFLKGRFQSLKNLRLHIKDRISHVMGTYWVAACIGIHAFAIRHEAEEKLQDPDFDEFSDNPSHWQDPFINDGLTTTSESDPAADPIQLIQGHLRARMPTRLQLARVQREKLKDKLFRSKVKKTQRIAQERREALGVDISSSESL